MDAVTLEVVYNATIQIVRELTINLARTGYSLVVKELQDATFAILDRDGRLVAQYFVSPAHLGVIDEQVREVLRRYRDTMEPGDAFIVNHPYQACQNHNSDITIVSPMYYRDELVAIVANTAHKTDIGGGSPGSNPSDATDVFQEGLLIPPMRLYRRGELNEDLAEIIRANSRTPELTWGDTKAQALSNVYGSNKLTQLMDKFGCQTVLDCWSEWIGICGNELRKRISEIPDGIYGPVTGYMDDDGIEWDSPLKISVKLEKKGETLHFIFDSGPQTRGPANIRPGIVKSAVTYCVKAALQPDLPNNHGCLEPVKVSVPPEGHQFNPRFPAPLNLHATILSRTAPIIMRLLALVVPDRVAAPAAGCTGALILAGPNPRSGRWYNSFEVVAGGYGARPTMDGVSCVDNDTANNLNMPIEALETEFPVMIERYELRPDSGGAGRYRGGLGIRRDWKMLSEGTVLNLRSDGHKFPSVGVFGAKPAACSRFTLNPGTPEEQAMHSKVRGFFLKQGDTVSWENGGGGGWGNPLDRPIEDVLADVLDGYVTIAGAREDYGVVIDPEAMTVDRAQTERLRSGSR